MTDTQIKTLAAFEEQSISWRKWIREQIAKGNGATLESLVSELLSDDSPDFTRKLSDNIIKMVANMAAISIGVSLVEIDSERT